MIYQTVFQSGWTKMHFYQQCIKVSVAAHPHQYLTLSVFWVFHFLTEPFQQVCNGMSLWFNLHFLLTGDVELFSACLITIHISSLLKRLFESFAIQSLIGFFVFLLLSFESYRCHTRELKDGWYCWEPVMTGCISLDGRSIHSVHLSHHGHLVMGLWANARWDWGGCAEEGVWLAFIEWVIISNGC